MSHLIIISSLFVAFIIIFHIAMFKLGPRPSLWKCVDYIWLSVASFGLIVSGASIYLTETEQELERERGSLSSTPFWASPALAVTIDHYSNPPEYLSKEMRWEYELAVGWFKQAKALIFDEEPCYKLYFDQTFNRSKSNHRIPEIRKDQDIILNIINGLRDKCSRVAQLEADAMSLYSFKHSAKYLGPILLAFAIALRFTKTTASLKGYT
ncbi:hypothetical protein [Pseudodesulfovibrio senegalensis]|uniref:Uncharacterized protein n=1 Tax=Pseudodesulfovibrio senegalensis TaxID=1721087 RepID=A0A6N6MYA8_9BACT|nr:hypothetical protein [Pseudodesulfovibrio senegalensis]KAB1440344.1 hypothetical protein F8A88_13930 [Pseudodesulfovibrio senegalensis]